MNPTPNLPDHPASPTPVRSACSRRTALRWLTLGAGAVSLAPTLPLAARAGGTPPPRLADLWSGRASLQIEPNPVGAAFGMHFLSTAWKGSLLHAYYIAPGFEIGLATSRDGTHFTNHGTVIRKGAPGAWDSAMASFPGVWLDGSTWYCVYEGSGAAGRWPGDIGLATSGDGFRWTKFPAPILVHQGGGWERQNIGTPSLWKDGGTFRLFYHGFGKVSKGPDDCQVGYATGRSLTALTRASSNPVLRTSAAGFDSGTIGRRSILREGSTFYMIFEASTDQPYASARWTSGLARSSNLATWEKLPSPVLPQTTRGFGFDGPEFVQFPSGQIAVYFRDPTGVTKRALLRWKTGR